MRITSGACTVSFACDIGQSLDLDACRRLITDATEDATLAHRHRVPTWFQFDTPPLRVRQTAPPLVAAGRACGPGVETVLYDFGAASISYDVAFDGSLEDLADFSAALAADTRLQADAVARIDALLDVIRPAVTAAHRSELIEDYLLFHVRELEGAAAPSALVREHGPQLAAILRSERTPLSDQELAEALGGAVSFSRDDLTLIDWNAALVFDREADDVRAVLEFANVQLLELRFLDRQLDQALDRAYVALSRPHRGPLAWLSAPGAELPRIGRLQVESAVLFERVSNALKLVGDQFLARVHGQAVRRLHLPDWHAAIVHKLDTLESIYAKLHDAAATRRLEVLEWIVIVLIAVGIVLPLLGVLH